MAARLNFGLLALAADGVSIGNAAAVTTFVNGLLYVGDSEATRIRVLRR
jgi:hypothetical protein